MASVNQTQGKRKVGDGTPGPGRPKGSQNKTTVALKDAILQAGELAGEDGKGRGGLVGYLLLLAKSQPVAFSALLGRVLPLTVAGDPENPLMLSLSERMKRAEERVRGES